MTTIAPDEKQSWYDSRKACWIDTSLTGSMRGKRKTSQAPCKTKPRFEDHIKLQQSQVEVLVLHCNHWEFLDFFWDSLLTDQGLEPYIRKTPSPLHYSMHSLWEEPND